MEYAIAVTTYVGTSVESLITGRFDDDGLREFWSDLSVTTKTLRDWRQSKGAAALKSEFPTLSRLAYVDEGEVTLGPESLESECTAAVSKVISSNAKNILASLEQAAKEALRLGGTVQVFPNAAAEAVGDRTRVTAVKQRESSVEEIAVLQSESEALEESPAIRRAIEYMEQLEAGSKEPT